MNGHNEQGPSIDNLLASFPQPVPLSDMEAMHFAGLHLTSLIANNTSADFECIWQELTHLPEGLLVLLDNPEGWQALSVIACGLMGVETAQVAPVIH